LIYGIVKIWNKKLFLQKNLQKTMDETLKCTEQSVFVMFSETTKENLSMGGKLYS
jgi:hypothetical protein